jgi:hypothetical protein
MSYNHNRRIKISRISLNESEKAGAVTISELIQMISTPEFIDGVADKLPSKIRSGATAPMYESAFSDWLLSLSAKGRAALKAIGEKFKAGIQTATKFMAFLSELSAAGIKKLSAFAKKLIDAISKIGISKQMGKIFNAADSIVSVLNMSRLASALPKAQLQEGRRINEQDNTVDSRLGIAASISLVMAIVAVFANILGQGAFGEYLSREIMFSGNSPVTLGQLITGVAGTAAVILNVLRATFAASSVKESVSSEIKGIKLVPSFQEFLKETYGYDYDDVMVDYDEDEDEDELYNDPEYRRALRAKNKVDLKYNKREDEMNYDTYRGNDEDDEELPVRTSPRGFSSRVGRPKGRK